MNGSRSASLALALTLSGGLLIAASALSPAQKRAARKSRPTAAAPAGKVSFAKDVAPFVQKYCGGCHGASVKTAGIDFSAYKDPSAMLKARSIWENVSTNLHTSRMPPAGSPQPTLAERQKVATWIDTTLNQADCDLHDPGRVTLRRLNREEYNNTIRDLLGVEFRPADDFPSDDVGYGFDNIGDVLSISPILMEKYLSAAQKITDAAIWTEDPLAAPKRIEAAVMNPPAPGSGTDKGGRMFATNAEVTTELPIAKEGDYTLAVRAYGQLAGNEPPKMLVKVGDVVTKQFDVTVTDKPHGLYPIKAHLPAGKTKVSIAFINDFADPMAADAAKRDRNLIVDFLEISGPTRPRPTPLPASHMRLFAPAPDGKDDAAARKILSAFARRAWRRPVTADEVERLVKYVQLVQKEGESFNRGIQVAVQAALVSPNFLFKVEFDAKPNDPKAAHPVGDYEIASRLSYFLWSTMPDEQLFALAAKGKLKDPKVLAAQARRMLKDPKARAMVDNFAGQWLQLRNLALVNPDPVRFPTFNDKLRAAMRRETEMFFEAVVREDRSITDFIDGKFTYVNEDLARHYGIPGVTGEQFRRVELSDENRGGILTQASILTVTSNPTRTSPVKRGKWILEEILGTPPPPPPPDVPELKEDVAGSAGAMTLRQKMELHRKDPNCATCHARMDPLGFGLENFNAIGAWRSEEGKTKIDSSGVLPDGRTFAGPAKLKAILKAEKGKFAQALTQKLMTFALGRGLEYYDKCAVRDIAARLGQQDYKFSALVTGIISSDPFRMRRGDGGSTQ